MSQACARNPLFLRFILFLFPVTNLISRPFVRAIIWRSRTLMMSLCWALGLFMLNVVTIVFAGWCLTLARRASYTSLFVLCTDSSPCHGSRRKMSGKLLSSLGTRVCSIWNEAWVSLLIVAGSQPRRQSRPFPGCGSADWACAYCLLICCLNRWLLSFASCTARCYHREWDRDLSLSASQGWHFQSKWAWEILACAEGRESRNIASWWLCGRGFHSLGSDSHTLISTPIVYWATSLYAYPPWPTLDNH